MKKVLLKSVKKNKKNLDRKLICHLLFEPSLLNNLIAEDLDELELEELEQKRREQVVRKVLKKDLNDDGSTYTLSRRLTI